MKYTDTSVSEAFATEVDQKENAISLGRAGLLFAQSHYPDLDCDWYLKQFDIVADAIQSRISQAQSGETRLGVTIEYLFGELGYQGNAEDYYDPRNSFINEVIDRRIGIPISLSVVFLEIASRVGIKANGVAFPGHFLVRVSESEVSEPVIVDPFDNGTSLGLEMFVARFRKRLDKPMSKEIITKMLSPASKRDILIRQLRNLLAIYSNKRSLEDCLLVVNHILYLNPDLLNEIIHRGKLYDEMGYKEAAVLDYEKALSLSEDKALTASLETALHAAKLENKPIH